MSANVENGGAKTGILQEIAEADLALPRAANGRFLPGISGGGGPYKKGSRHKATIIAQALIDDEGQEVVRKVIDGAKEGDPACMKLVIDRLVPPRKSAPLKIDLPAITDSASARDAIGVILAAQCGGDLTSCEAETLLKTVEAFLRASSVADLEERISKLEDVG